MPYPVGCCAGIPADLLSPAFRVLDPVETLALGFDGFAERVHRLRIFLGLVGSDRF